MPQRTTTCASRRRRLVKHSLAHMTAWASKKCTSAHPQCQAHSSTEQTISRVQCIFGSLGRLDAAATAMQRGAHHYLCCTAVCDQLGCAVPRREGSLSAS